MVNATLAIPAPDLLASHTTVVIAFPAGIYTAPARASFRKFRAILAYLTTSDSIDRRIDGGN